MAGFYVNLLCGPSPHLHHPYYEPQLVHDTILYVLVTDLLE